MEKLATYSPIYTTPLSPYVVANVAACPACNGLVRRSSPLWWQRLLRDNRVRFHCRQCGESFYRHG